MRGFHGNVHFLPHPTCALLCSVESESLGDQLLPSNGCVKNKMVCHTGEHTRGLESQDEELWCPDEVAWMLWCPTFLWNMVLGSLHPWHGYSPATAALLPPFLSCWPQSICQELDYTLFITSLSFCHLFPGWCGCLWLYFLGKSSFFAQKFAQCVTKWEHKL